MMYACLFAGLGVSLREPMRAGASDDDLRDLIARIWGGRDARYSEERTERATPQDAPRKIEMYQIGG
jgi:cyclic pyranopterin phosphate synthase